MDTEDEPRRRRGECEIIDSRLSQPPLLRMDSARACDRRCLRLHLAPQSRDYDFWPPLFRHSLGARLDVGSAGDQFLPARHGSRLERRVKFLWAGGRYDVFVVHVDDVCIEIKRILNHKVSQRDTKEKLKPL